MMQLTRQHVRRAGWWLAIALGVLGFVGYAVCVFTQLRIPLGSRSLFVGDGAIEYRWAERVFSNASGARVPPPPFPEPPGWWCFPYWQAPESVFGGRAIIPLWIPVFIGAIALYRALPTGVANGSCPKCRFDLSSSPPVDIRTVQVRCPECGTLSQHQRAESGAAPDQHA